VAAALGEAVVLAAGAADHSGAEVQAVAGDTHTCEKCGASNTGAAKFCASCGAPFQVSGGKGMTAGKAILIFLAVLIVVALGLGGCAYSGYRQTIAMDESVKSSWAQVEVVLKRRFDLIPNVVETVKGYAKHEQGLLQGIADVRKSYFSATTTAEKAQAAGTLDGMLSRLLVLRETYPELKANENFRALQIELEGTENRIAEKRSRYNDSVRSLNSYIRAFPGSMYAGWSHVQKAEYFEAGEGAKEAPQVKF
jgi:LemA protein